MARYPIYTVLSWAESLHQLMHGYQVDGGPGQPGPLVSRNWAQVIAGGILRAMSEHILDERASRSVKSQGHDLVRLGSGGLVESYDGDGPPWRDLPWPLPWPPKKFDPKASIFEGLKPGLMDQVLVATAHRLAETASRLPVAQK